MMLSVTLCYSNQDDATFTSHYLPFIITDSSLPDKKLVGEIVFHRNPAPVLLGETRTIKSGAPY
jgi:hypothetical protein